MATTASKRQTWRHVAFDSTQFGYNPPQVGQRVQVRYMRNFDRRSEGFYAMPADLPKIEGHPIVQNVGRETVGYGVITHIYQRNGEPDEFAGSYSVIVREA